MVRTADLVDLGAVSDTTEFVSDKAGTGSVLATAVRTYVLAGAGSDLAAETAARIAADSAESAARIAADAVLAAADAALVSAAMDPVVTASTLAAARALFLKLEDGVVGAPAFPMVGSSTTGWFRHTSTVDPVSGSANTWCLAVDGVERYRFFDSVLSCNLPAGDNFGITDGSRVFHIGNDGSGYYVSTTTDHMLRVGSFNLAGPGVIFGDQASGGTGFTGRTIMNPGGQPFNLFKVDLVGTADGFTFEGGANSIMRITSGAGTRINQAFYKTGATLVGQISTDDTTTTYTTTSDMRLKLRGAAIESGTILDALDPFMHTWAAHDKAPAVPGMSAQAVFDVVPSAITVGRGEPGDPDFVPWMSDWSRLIPVLVAEIKALRVRVATLEAA